jgi:hypothetical protein
MHPEAKLGCLRREFDSAIMVMKSANDALPAEDAAANSGIIVTTTEEHSLNSAAI